MVRLKYESVPEQASIFDIVLTNPLNGEECYGHELGEYAGKYAYEEKVKEKTIGKGICPICGSKSKLIRRKGYLWECEICQCTSSNHTRIIKEKYYTKYKAGDHIRVYETTFAKESRLILNSYSDGIVTKIYPGIGGYYLDYIVKREVLLGEETPSSSWVIGKTRTGLRHDSKYIKLITGGKKL